MLEFKFNLINFLKNNKKQNLILFFNENYKKQILQFVKEFDVILFSDMKLNLENVKTKTINFDFLSFPPFSLDTTVILEYTYHLSALNSYARFLKKHEFLFITFNTYTNYLPFKTDLKKGIYNLNNVYKTLLSINFCKLIFFLKETENQNINKIYVLLQRT